VKRQSPATTPAAAPAAAIIACGGGGKLTPGGTLPNELVLCPWGIRSTRKGRFEVGAHTLAVFSQRQAAMRRDMVAGDFEHGTLKKEDPVRVACYGVPRVVEGVGIVADINHWTPDGKEFVGGGHYPDISPALEVNAAGQVIGLHSFAFCRHGEIADDSLQIFSADSQPQIMNLLTLLNAVLAALSIPPVKDNATPEDLAAVMAQATAAAKAKSETEVEVEPMSADADKITPILAPLITEVRNLRADVVALTAADTTRKIDNLLSAAKAAGKAIGLKPATLYAMGADAVTEYLDSLPENAVPLQGANGGTGTQSAADAKVEAFSADQKAMFSRMGMTAEEVAKAAEEMHGVKLSV